MNSLLDVARRTYTESIDDVYLLVNQYSADNDLALSLKFSPSAGFYLSFTTATSTSHIPPLFVNVVKKKNRVTCSTLELVNVVPSFKITAACSRIHFGLFSFKR